MKKLVDIESEEIYVCMDHDIDSDGKIHLGENFSMFHRRDDDYACINCKKEIDEILKIRLKKIKVNITHTREISIEDTQHD